MKEIKISVLCPTRGRPQLMQRVVEKCLETCSDPSQIEIVFGIDDDDIKSIEKAKELQKQFSSDNIEYTVWPRKKYIFSDLINQCSKAASGEIFNLMSDDAVHDSKDWLLQLYFHIESGFPQISASSAGEVSRSSL